MGLFDFINIILLGLRSLWIIDLLCKYCTAYNSFNATKETFFSEYTPFL